MKYYIDTEFIEGFHKPLFGKRRHFIDLISIGIVCEDGGEYYAVSNEFNPKDANQWVKDNVISKLPKRRVDYYDGPRMRADSLLWKSNNRIADDIKKFIYKTSGINDPFSISNWDQIKSKFSIEFYGYYADYDWVLFCSLFGTMMDLPKGFPMYCRDLKQSLDEANYQLRKAGIDNALLNCEFHSFTMDNNGSNKRLEYQCHNDYPKETNEHHALADARWNMALHKFLEHL